MSGSISYLTPFQQTLYNATGIDPFALPPSPNEQQAQNLLTQMLLAEQQAAPKAPPAPNESAVNTLIDISSGGTANETPYGGVGPQGNASLGSFRADVEAARNIGLDRFGLSLAANPASLMTGIPATLAAAAVRGITGQPNPNQIQNAWGLRGLAQALRGAYTGMPVDKPYSMTATEAMIAAEQLAAASAAAKGGTGYGGSKDDTMADVVGWGAEDKGQASTEGGSKDSGPSGGGGPAGGGGGGAASGPGDESESGGFGAAKRGGLATPYGFMGPEKFAGGGQVIELQGGGKVAVGPGGGLDDLIPTSINGRRAAALSDGEFVVPADVVSMMGDGSSNAGARRLYDLVRQIREAKTGTARQAGPLPVGEILKRTMS
jgi:hypothetical protein